MSFLNGYKTYLLSFLGGLISATAGMNGEIAPVWSTLITIGFAVIAAFRHGQKTDAKQHALDMAKFMAEEVKTLLIEKGVIKADAEKTVEQNATNTMIDGQKLIESIQALMQSTQPSK